MKGRGITIFIGEDCGEAANEIIQFADLVEANIVTSPAGKRWISAQHPRYCGVFGFAGHDSARRALTDDGVDLVLAVGTSFNELDTAGWDTQAFDRRPAPQVTLHGHGLAGPAKRAGAATSRLERAARQHHVHPLRDQT